MKKTVSVLIALVILLAGLVPMGLAEGEEAAPAVIPAVEAAAPAEDDAPAAEEPSREAETPAEEPTAIGEEPAAPADEPESLDLTEAAPAAGEAPAEGEAEAPADGEEEIPENGEESAPVSCEEEAPAEDGEAAPAAEEALPTGEAGDAEDIEEYETPLGEEIPARFYVFLKLTKEDGTDVRERPDGMSPICATLPAGINVPLLGVVGGWYEVYCAGRLGYIYCGDVNIAMPEVEEELAEAEELADAEEAAETEEPTEGEEPAETEEPVETEEPAVEDAEPAAEDTEETPAEGEKAAEDGEAEEGEPEEGKAEEADPEAEMSEEGEPEEGDVANTGTNLEQTMKVTLFSSRRTIMEMGETVRLTSRIEGFDGYEILYVWKCDKHDGNGLTIVQSGSASYLEYTASVESLSWDWELSVWYR